MCNKAHFLTQVCLFARLSGSVLLFTSGCIITEGSLYSMVNICTLEQLQVLIGKGIVKGCGCCKARFEEDDLACARQTGICPYCNNKLVKVFTKNMPAEAV